MASRRSVTRERVLEVALALFNARGPGKVTTAEIAEGVGINEGHLYYYFKRKEHIVAALFDWFEQALLAVAAPPDGDPENVSTYQAYLQGWFRLMSDYRCFYQHGAALFAAVPALRPRLHLLIGRSQMAAREVLARMVAHGLLQAPPEGIDPLLTNVWIVSCYWMDYLHLQTGRAELGPAEFAWGAAQVQSLLAPYLRHHT